MASAGPDGSRPLRSAPFRWYFAGRSISLAGSAMAPVALAFGVLGRTGSAGWVSAVVGTAMVATVATMLFGGGIADRYRRSTVLSLTSLGAGLSQAGVAVLLLTDQHPALLLPFAVGNGVFQGLTTPVLRGIVSNLASGRGLQRASSLLASAGNLARILGPAGAGLLTASVGGGWAIAADAVSFLLAAACFARIAMPEPPKRAGDAPTMLSDLREGWTYFASQPWIWSVTLAFAVFNATDRGVWQVLGPVIAFHTIGATGWGLVLSAQGVGALLASVVLVHVPLMRRPMRPVLAAMALAALPLVLLGAGAGIAWLAAASLLAGVATELFTVAWETVNYTHISERLLSRVGAHDEFWSFVSFPLGQLSAPVLAAAFGSAAVALSGGTVAALAMLAASLLPVFRHIELRPAER
ncbi:MFS transporter [Dactylosporangium sp. NPDC051541]|uniref:MFS transporter n=1 Tax=Dactylosporangium sp. NPDC051541 TaxID=3363977 RepID=UPI0037891AD3